ncbi:MAG: EpsI family protein [Armatimonadota bacterium]
MQHITTRYIAAALILLLGGGGYIAVDQLRPRQGDYSPDFEAIPRTIDGYSAEELPVEEWVFNFLEADRMLELAYTSEEPSRPPVHVNFVYGKHWRSIHTPIHCYPAQGWLIVSQKAVTIPLANDASDGDAVEVNQVHVSKNDTEMIIWYVLAYVGGTTANWTRMGFEVATGPRGGGGMVITLSTTVDRSDPAKTDMLLAAFVRKIYPPLRRSWY